MQKSGYLSLMTVQVDKINQDINTSWLTQEAGCWVSRLQVRTRAWLSTAPSPGTAALLVDGLGSDHRVQHHYSLSMASRAEAVFKPSMCPLLFKGHIIPDPQLSLGRSLLGQDLLKYSNFCALAVSPPYNHSAARCSLLQHPDAHGAVRGTGVRTDVWKRQELVTLWGVQLPFLHSSYC